MNESEYSPSQPRRVRQKIIFEAARLLHEGQETSIGKAKFRAARRLYRGYLDSDLFPTDAEVASYLSNFEGTTSEPDQGRWGLYEAFLRPLERIEMPRSTHPEGDALYHSLQVFALVAESNAYDEELQTAALLHEIGRAIDPWNAIDAGIDALGDLITDRTRWFIEQLPVANGRFNGRLGTRARSRLAGSEDSEELTLLSDCDRRGRVSGDAGSDR